MVFEHLLLVWKRWWKRTDTCGVWQSGHFMVSQEESLLFELTLVVSCE